MMGIERRKVTIILIETRSGDHVTIKLSVQELVDQNFKENWTGTVAIPISMINQI